MSFDVALSALYSLVPIISLVGYIPQIMALIKTKERIENCSYSMWIILFTSNVISLAYGAIKVQDLLFCITVLSHLLPISLIMLITYIKSQKSFAFVMPRLKINQSIGRNIDHNAYQAHSQGNQDEYVQSAKDHWVIAVNHALIAEQAQTIQ